MGRFKVWIDNVSADNIMSYDSFNSDSERKNGFEPGTRARSIAVNSALRQANLVTSAFMEIYLPNSTLDLTSSLDSTLTNLRAVVLTNLTNGSGVNSVQTNTTSATNKHSVALGEWTKAAGEYSLAIGSGSKANAYCSFAGGVETTANTWTSFAFGYKTLAHATQSFAIGNATIAIGSMSFVSGKSCVTYSYCCHAEGNHCFAGKAGYDDHDLEGEAAHAEGIDSIASGTSSHAEGNGCQATGHTSHAEGTRSYATGVTSHAEGFECHATGDFAHAQGRSCEANGRYSFAGGVSSIASGDNSFAFGDSCNAIAAESYAGGLYSAANAAYSWAYGYKARTSSSVQGQVVFGLDNVVTDDAFIIGRGDGQTSKNIFSVSQNGDVKSSSMIAISSKQYSQLETSRLAISEHIMNHDVIYMLLILEGVRFQQYLFDVTRIVKFTRDVYGDVTGYSTEFSVDGSGFGKNLEVDLIPFTTGGYDVIVTAMTDADTTSATITSAQAIVLGYDDPNQFVAK